MPPVVERSRATVDALAESCRACYQCGRCRSACPQGLDLADGPRAVVRLVLAQDAERLLACEDVWRCSECGACTEACPTGVDVAGVLAAVRALQRTEGGARCPERSGADLAARQLKRRPTLNSLTLGLRMAVRGFLPRGSRNAMSLGAGALRGVGLSWPEAGELYRIGNQINQRHSQQGTVGLRRRQRMDIPRDISSFCLRLEIAQGIPDQLVKMDFRLVQFRAPDAREIQQVVNQIPHPFGRLGNNCQVPETFF